MRLGLGPLLRVLFLENVKLGVVDDIFRGCGQDERDEYADDPEHKNRADINIAKHRNGATGRFTLRFFGEYMRFENPTVGASEAIYADSETLS